MDFQKLRKCYISLVIHFDLASLEKKVHELEEKMNAETFWNDQKAAMQVVKELNEAKEKKEQYEDTALSFQSALDMLSLANEQMDDDTLELLDMEYSAFEEKLNALKMNVLFDEPFDHLNAILEFHPGAGGTESQDWADMLYRMYVRFAEAHHFKMQIIDYQAGDEAGLKSATIMIKGKNAYGLLKGEKGVHRLVRISPFDAAGRRHTSFASVNVIPEFKDEIDIEINEKDLRIDTYRSQGAGGQNVNKTESAVRITHIPTGIVVSSQVERSQIQNREIAMNMLKAHLYERRLQERKDEMNQIVGEQKNIEWGSQIRSYVFCPYTMVKDHRTNYQEGNVASVMDGNIDGFLYAYLEMEAKKHA